MTYSIDSIGSIIRDVDGACIGKDPANTDYQTYLAWVESGGQVTAYVAPPVAWADVQSSARAALSDSDITVLRCIESGIALPAEWATYRKSLRSIVGAPSGDASKPLPTRPAYPAGT